MEERRGRGGKGEGEGREGEGKGGEGRGGKGGWEGRERGREGREVEGDGRGGKGRGGKGRGKGYPAQCVTRTTPFYKGICFIVSGVMKVNLILQLPTHKSLETKLGYIMGYKSNRKKII